MELINQAQQAIDEYLRLTGCKPSQFLFTDRGGRGADDKAVHGWFRSGLRESAKTRSSLGPAVLIYRHTRNLQAVQLLFGHTKIESNVRYLGIEANDTIEIAEKIDI
ncbi:MAG: hypothetical protein QM780_16320 [Hyphomicrobium sp.]|uniref:hypothetical protein n=1 Tax=Hyphomicrobium sp. TaxID=82 RepID=UPI0039E5A7F4